MIIIAIGVMYWMAAHKFGMVVTFITVLLAGALVDFGKKLFSK